MVSDWRFDPLAGADRQALACPYCDGAHDCAWCEGTGFLYADEIEPRETPTFYDEEVECASLQPPLNDGNGGSAPSPETSLPSTRTSLTPATSRSESSPTESGRPDLSSRPVSGSSQAKPTPKPETCSQMKNSEPKSTDAPSILGANGHG